MFCPWHFSSIRLSKTGNCILLLKKCQNQYDLLNDSSYICYDMYKKNNASSESKIQDTTLGLLVYGRLGTCQFNISDRLKAISRQSSSAILNRINIKEIDHFISSTTPCVLFYYYM